jgi:hypothetical protein
MWRIPPSHPETIMRVTHPVNLLDGVRDAEAHLLRGRYRVYWTRFPGCNLKSFGVVDTQREMGPLGDAVVLDAAQSDGRAHCARVVRAANTLNDTAELLGLRVQVQSVAP